STYSATLDDEPGTRPGQRLDLDLETGAGVHIEGWDKSVVRVWNSHREQECPDAKIETHTTADGVRVRSYYMGDDQTHSCSLTLEIRVPTRYDVRLRSSGGDLVVRHLRGTIEGHTGGGSLVLDHVDGDVHLHSGGGDIRVTDCRLDGGMATGGG